MSNCSGCGSCGGCGGSSVIIAYGDQQYHGRVAGLSIKQVREALNQAVPGLHIPDDALAQMMTTEPNAAAWQQVASPEEPADLTVNTVHGPVTINGVAKDVPEDYVVRDDDVYLQFRDKA